MVSIELSFIIIEYDCLEDVFLCVDSIKDKCKQISYQVIVSSNSMYPLKKQDDLKEKFPHIKWLFNKSNKGFAGGVNSGILMSSGKVVVLMNPDVEILNGGIRGAFDYLVSHESVGLIGPRMVDREGNIQDSCREFMTPGRLLLRTCKRLIQGKATVLSSKFNYTLTRRVDWVIGAFAMIKREALAKVGLLDQYYFLYVEDMDWCKRFWDTGFQVVYYPGIEVKYKGDRKSTSPLVSKGLPNKYSFYHLKSYLRFLWKFKFRVSRQV